jgi:hypothetical protein
VGKEEGEVRLSRWRETLEESSLGQGEQVASVLTSDSLPYPDREDSRQNAAGVRFEMVGLEVAQVSFLLFFPLGSILVDWRLPDPYYLENNLCI